MKTKTLLKRLVQLLSICMLAGICFFSSGCTTWMVVSKAKGRDLDRTYAPHSLVSAEKLSNGDLQFVVHGYSAEDKSGTDVHNTGTDYTLVVSKSDLDWARKEALSKEIGGIRALRTAARLPNGVALPVETFQEDKLGEYTGVYSKMIKKKYDKPTVIVMINALDPWKLNEVNTISIYYSEPLSGRERNLVAWVETHKKPIPALYTLVPITAAVDLVTLPFQIAIFAIFNPERH